MNGTTAGIVVWWTVLAVAYWAPTITAIARHHRAGQVLVINLLTGWTIIGWIVALVLAVGPKTATVRLER